MPRGGRRVGAGRKQKAALPAAPSKDEAREILAFIELPENPHEPKDGKPCKCKFCRYREIADAPDLRLRLQVLTALHNRILGLPAKAAGEPEPGPDEGMMDAASINGRLRELLQRARARAAHAAGKAGGGEAARKPGAAKRAEQD